MDIAYTTVNRTTTTLDEILAAGNHIHEHTHWDAVCLAPRERWAFMAIEQNVLLSPMPVMTLPMELRWVSDGYNPGTLTRISDKEFECSQRVREGNLFTASGHFVAGYGRMGIQLGTLGDPTEGRKYNVDFVEGYVPNTGAMYITSDGAALFLSNGNDLELVAGKAANVVNGEMLMALHIPHDLQIACGAIAKRFKVLVGQPGSAGGMSKLLEAGQTPALNYGLTRTLNAYVKPMWINHV